MPTCRLWQEEQIKTKQCTRHQLGADSYKYNHEVRDSHSLQIPDAPPLDLQGSHGKGMFADTPNR